MDAGFFRGTSADQDNRFANKQKKLLKSLKFADGLDIKVDMRKINMETIKPWISRRITEMLGFEDDVVIAYVFNSLEEERFPDPKVLQINLTGFLNGKNSRQFLGEMWPLLTSAQENVTGIPESFLNQKKEEIRLRQIEAEKTVVMKLTEKLSPKENNTEQRKKEQRSYSHDHSHYRNRKSRSKSPFQHSTSKTMDLSTWNHNKLAVESKKKMKSEEICESQPIAAVSGTNTTATVASLAAFKTTSICDKSEENLNHSATTFNKEGILTHSTSDHGSKLKAQNQSGSRSHNNSRFEIRPKSRSYSPRHRSNTSRSRRSGSKSRKSRRRHSRSRSSDRRQRHKLMQHQRERSNSPWHQASKYDSRKRENRTRSSSKSSSSSPRRDQRHKSSRKSARSSSHKKKLPKQIKKTRRYSSSSSSDSGDVRYKTSDQVAAPTDPWARAPRQSSSQNVQTTEVSLSQKQEHRVTTMSSNESASDKEFSEDKVKVNSIKTSHKPGTVKRKSNKEKKSHKSKKRKLKKKKDCERHISITKVKVDKKKETASSATSDDEIEIQTLKKSKNEHKERKATRKRSPSSDYLSEGKQSLPQKSKSSVRSKHKSIAVSPKRRKTVETSSSTSDGSEELVSESKKNGSKKHKVNSGEKKASSPYRTTKHVRRGRSPFAPTLLDKKHRKESFTSSYSTDSEDDSSQSSSNDERKLRNRALASIKKK